MTTAEKKGEKTDSSKEKSATPAISQFSVDVELPSKGKFYPDGKPASVTLKPISVAEEKLLATTRSRLAVADKVLQRCIISDCISLDDMLVSDKFYLFLNLRSISYGPKYIFKIPCRCGHEFQYSVDLPTGLQIKVASEDDTEPFDVLLPVSGKTLSLRFLRGSDETAIEEYIKQLPSSGADDGDPSYVYRLALHISKMNGEEVNMIDRLAFCESMIGRDSFAMRSAISNHETGPVFEVEATCPSCHRDIQAPVALSSEFFQGGIS